MAAVSQLFRQAFVSTDTISITHNSDSLVVSVRVLVNDEVSNNLVSSILYDPSDPRNKLTVTLTSVQSGLVQIVSPGLAPSPTTSATADSWDSVLANGNTSGGTNPVISSGDSLLGEDNGAGTGGDIPITAGSSTAGNNDGGDVVINPGSGFGTGVDGIVQVNGPKHYANSATDPTLPAPAEGDRYYNTVLEMDMRYDGSRFKWLSVETCIINASDQGTLNSGSYFQVGTLRMAAARGYDAMFAGTVVSLGYTRTDTDAASFAVTAAGITIASVASTALKGFNNALDGDFVQDDVLAMRNDGVNALSNGIVWARVKWRA